MITAHYSLTNCLLYSCQSVFITLHTEVIPMFLISYSVIRLHSAGSRLQPVPLPIQEPPATGPVSGQVKVIPDALILERQNSKHMSMKRNSQLFLSKTLNSGSLSPGIATFFTWVHVPHVVTFVYKSIC